MLLFDESLAALENGMWMQLTDPDHSGVPPDGVSGVLHEGALVGATYFQPAIQVEPVDWLELRSGLVFAWSTAPVGQGFATFRNGGSPANHLGQDSSGYALGTEVDWAVAVGSRDDAAKTKLRAVLQGGHAWLSPALSRKGTRHDLLSAKGRFTW